MSPAPATYKDTYKATYKDTHDTKEMVNIEPSPCNMSATTEKKLEKKKGGVLIKKGATWMSTMLC